MSRRVDPVRRPVPPPCAVVPTPAPSRALAPIDRAGALLALQRSHGNREVARRVAAHQVGTHRVGARRVGAPTDRAEHAADRVARAVTGIAPGAGTHVHDAVTGRVPPAVAAGIAASRGGGRPLPGDLRARMEGALGTDLGGVRLHTGLAADGLSRSLQARAFTTGSDVFVRSGEPGPSTAAGRGLLAHELAHVAQGQADPAAPIGRLLHPAHLHDASPWAMNEWFTPSGWFDPLDGTHARKKRAGTVEAVVPPGPVRGSKPQKGGTLLGWHWVHQFGGTKAHGHWVQFHILNENLGGRGSSKLNLVPATQATNKRADWTTHFDEKAKRTQAGGEPVHLIAEVTYHDRVAAPTQPGQPYLPFFPKRIEATYRVWRGGAWRTLAEADLDDIPPPPVHPQIIPVRLATDTTDRIQLRVRTLDPDFLSALDFAKKQFVRMTASTTLQEIYEVVSDSAAMDRARSRNFGGQESLLQLTLDTQPGWWPTLQWALTSAGPAKRLIVNDRVDVVGAAPALTRTRRAKNERKAKRQAELAAQEMDVVREQQGHQRARANSQKTFDDMWKGLPG